MESHYDIAQICLNGHVITSMAEDYPEFKRDFCDKCGEETITECQECYDSIQGYHHAVGVIGGPEYVPPKFCHSCGKPFPWIKTSLDTFKEIVELTDLNENERTDFIETITELVKQTSKVPLAKIKLKKYLSRINNDLANSLSEILDNVLSEELKKSIKK